MALPKTYRGFLQLMIQIAEHGNDYSGESKLTYDDQMEIGGMIADIQNALGENAELLDKFKLKYNS